MDVFDLGDEVPLTFVVAVGDPPVAAEPDAVTVVVSGPDGADEAERVAELVDPLVPGLWSAGVFVPDQPGVWLERWTVTGEGAGVTETAVVVRPEDSALPYAATVEGVRARVLDVARPTGVAPAGGAQKAPRVSDATVAEWLLEGGARVARKLRLIESLGASESDPLRLSYRAAARGLTELYAAALLWDATYPQAAKGERYGAVLYERYEKGLAELAGDLAIDVDNQERPSLDGVPGDLSDVMGGGGAAARFPVADPRISRWRPW